MKRTLDKLTIVNIFPPTDLLIATAEVVANPNAIHPVLVAEVDGPTATEGRIWQREVDAYVRCKAILNRDLKILYLLVWGNANQQCKTSSRVSKITKYYHQTATLLS